MQDRLVIFFAAEGAPSWVTVAADGQVAARVMTGEPEALQMAAMGKSITLVVPADDVLLTAAVLPKLSRARLLQALPYAIEDQLTSDVEALHFVPAETQADGLTPVAVVAKEKMHHWQSWLQSMRIQADRLIPAPFLLPVEEGVWHVAVSDTAVVRTGAWSGFGCEVSQLSEWLAIALASSIKKPRAIHVHDYTNQSVSLSSLNFEVIQNKLPADQCYQDMARQIATPAMDLFVGEYASRKAKYPQMSTVKKAIAWLGVAWLVLLLLYPLISFLILKTHLSGIQSQMWSIYKKQFPQATSMVAPKLRFEEKLHKQTASLGENRFLLLLAYLGEGMRQSPGVMIKRMDFQGGILTMDLTATTEAFAALTDYLSHQGLQVKQQNASVTDERVSATVQVE